MIARALPSSDDISFMILVGAAGENGIRQTAYYIYQQLICEDVPEDKARLAEQRFIGLYFAQTFDEYRDAAKPLVDDPRIRQMGFVTAMWTEDQWKAYEGDEESFYDPVSAIRNADIPTLVVFGALDKNVNPMQGVEAFTSAFEIVTLKLSLLMARITISSCLRQGVHMSGQQEPRKAGQTMLLNICKQCGSGSWTGAGRGF